jgi:hypothetical protein
MVGCILSALEPWSREEGDRGEKTALSGGGGREGKGIAEPTLMGLLH